MMMAGGNAPIPSDKITVRILTQSPADISAFCLHETGKVNDDLDMVFYGQKSSADQTVCLLEEGINTEFQIDLLHLKSSIQKIAFSTTCDQGKIIPSLGSLSIQIEHQNKVLLTGQVDLSERTEAALILGEVYRRNQEWKFRFIAQGFNGGLQPLAEHFGVDIDDSSKTSLSINAPSDSEPLSHRSSSIRLSKISLTKATPKVSLDKRSNYGQIKINLNWNHQSALSQSQEPPKKGLFNRMLGGSSNNGIDLDLGAFIRLKNGEAGIVQALGGQFGHYHKAPFVQLLEDDRTGQSHDGEWLHINGEYWAQIDEILVYAFIYKGVPDWEKTDGIVTINVQNERPIETRLTEGKSGKGMCAIARFVNKSDQLQVERLDQYFSGHQALDKAFGWGFRWKSGNK